MPDTGFARRHLPWICALILAVLHLFAVVAPLVASQGRGEGQAFIVALVDFPLVLLLRALPNGSYILYNSTVAYIWFFSIAGTLMYAAIGCCLGILVRALVR